jgi:hypothetical protein
MAARQICPAQIAVTRRITVALMAGGSYFVFYWGISLVYHLGSWGFKLGLYI